MSLLLPEEVGMMLMASVQGKRKGKREALGLIGFLIVCFYPCRYEFSNYLNRPDHKQEFVYQWQQSYNSIAEHLRKEDAMKIELHNRVDVSTLAFPCTITHTPFSLTPLSTPTPPLS